MRGFRLGERRVDLAAGTVIGPTGTVSLTPTEGRLLGYLARRAGQLVPRDALLTDVWGYRPGVVSRTIDNTTARLRQKVEDDPSDPRHLISVYGQGLRLEGVKMAFDAAEGASFVGRTAERAALSTELFRNTLVTVVGPAGVGKSRIAMEVVRHLGLDVIVAACGAVRAPADLDATVRDALGRRGSEGSPVSALAARIDAVLVLDECELAIDVVQRRLSEWLPQAPRLRVLATSREPLGLAQERVFTLGPLEPDDAAALFRARLPAGAPDVPLDAVRHLVDQVDALPLALELAAARCAVVGHERLTELLRAPLAVLGGPGRRSMAEVLERSFDALPPPLRRHLTALAVFEATFDLDELGAVTELTGGAALDCVESLLSRSLLRADGVRWRLYTTVRERARRDLGPDDPARLRHARWFARYGEPERITRASRDAAQRDGLSRAVPDLRMAAAYVRDRDPDLAERCGLALLWQLGRVGAYDEALALEPEVRAVARSPRVRILLALCTAKTASAHGDMASGIARIEDVLPLAELPFDVVHLRCTLAIYLRTKGDSEAATAQLAHAQPFVAAAEDAEAFWLMVRGYNHPDRAVGNEMLREGARVARRFGNANLEINNLLFLAELLLRGHELAEAGQLLVRALELCARDDVAPRNRAFALFGTGRLRRFTGRLDEAEELLERSLAWTSPGLTTGIVHVDLAKLAVQRGRNDEARALLEPLRWERFRPERLACEAQVVWAEILVREAAPDAVAALVDALAHARTGEWPDLACALLELLAAATGDPAHLDEADGLPLNQISAVRRDAIQAWIAANRGDARTAEAALERAVAGAADLGLGPDAEFTYWVHRAEAAIADHFPRRPLTLAR